MNTLSNQSSGTQIFLSVFTLSMIWILFVNDYSRVELQSPIRFGTTDVGPAVDQHLVISDAQVPTNDAAPVVDLPPKDVKSYIAKWAGVAVEEMRRTGIPASISMAQALIESRAGCSALALTGNNHFGIKCSVSGKCKAGHCINFHDDIDTDYFLVYQNGFQSWKGHSEFLKKPRYRKCFEQSSPEGWARELKSAGYATDPAYARKLVAIIKKYKLDLLDK